MRFLDEYYQPSYDPRRRCQYPTLLGGATMRMSSPSAWPATDDVPVCPEAGSVMRFASRYPAPNEALGWVGRDWSRDGLPSALGRGCPPGWEINRVTGQCDKRWDSFEPRPYGYGADVPPPPGGRPEPPPTTTQASAGPPLWKWAVAAGLVTVVIWGVIKYGETERRAHSGY